MYQRGLPRGDPDDPDDFRLPGGLPRRGPPRGGPPRPPTGPPGGGPPGMGPPGGLLPRNTGNNRNQDDGFRFNLKIKTDEVPTWDGNEALWEMLPSSNDTYFDWQVAHVKQRLCHPFWIGNLTLLPVPSACVATQNGW